jgi:hypothetical protein
MERTWVLFGLLFSLFFACQCISLYSQQNGFKYFTGYTPAEYGLQPQNWSILQDKRGIIYIGNQGGLAEYDGVSWRKIQIPNRTVRSLTIDDKGIIYVGGKNEIGYLKSDSMGALKYISLLDHIDEKQKKFGNVWKAHAIGKIVYFRTSKYLFGWKPDAGKMKVWSAPDKEKKFVSSFVCEGKFFVFQRRVGLMQVIKGSLRLVPGSEAFERKWINMVVPYDENRMLVGTYKDGFYLYDGSIFIPFTTGVDEYVK